ncbi:hypothetical protein BMF94_1302 [Rhodotorula taiwanensis]|uniref:Zn(2)-C6 fungal-type domain-containing protein n=1 Tax=Rhodotorula taiwanensis TaxID=741276 RepID=A0A2S5BFY3_9BASI|nr:hypothetical protein BMF94_1302 [Rhodotorula taiwanensis]
MTTYAQMSPGQSGSPHDSYSATESAGDNNNANNSSFFTSNHYYNASPSTSTALLPVSTSSQQPPPAQRSTQVFLPPLPPTRATSGDLGVGGATFLSDEETNASDSPVGASSYPPLTGATTRPRAARQSSVASSVSVDTVSGQPRAKGKGGGNGAGTNKKKGAAGAKRKQQIGPDGKPLPKKKKAGRACAACQKAHLTCDDARPCARCIKKGCPEECVDGARKKAKYLQEIPDELLAQGRGQTAGPNATPSPAGMGGEQLDSGFFNDSPGQQPEPQLDHPLIAGTQGQPQPQSQPFFDFTSPLPTSAAPNSTDFAAADPSSYLSFATTSLLGDSTQFGSEAAGFEYAILNAMLNGNGFAVDQNATSSLMSGPNGPGGILAGSHRNSDADPMLLDPSTGGSGGPAGDNPFGLGTTHSSLFNPDPPQEATASSAAAGSSARTATGPSNGALTAEEVYRNVTKPYPYAQSYHFLVKHLKARFEKNDILRIIRALATFRPSLIALQMPLTEEDETFVERTFQRTLVELNKLISFSGTPTVVWRRTGEICLVGTEFCLLTGWKREELVGKKYIFEASLQHKRAKLFDTASVVEYFESFAKHAFESTATSITMQCVVLAPDGRPVPCAFCFSVRRDLFSCPFLIIGSFLPILV